MTTDHMLQTVFHAATWRAMHGVPTYVAMLIALGVALLAWRRR